jgi:hypothetical protein
MILKALHKYIRIYAYTNMFSDAAPAHLPATPSGGFSFGAEGGPICVKPVSVSQCLKSPCQSVFSSVSSLCESASYKSV